MFESFHGDEDPPGDLYPERRSPWGLIGDSDFDGDIRGGILVESSKRPLFDAFFFLTKVVDVSLRCEFFLIRFNLRG